MNKLPENFTFHRYGLDVRLVNESDTEFILSLRTDSAKSRYLHPTENDVAKHLEWFRKYKQREAEGRDYYFIYYKEGRPVGVNRVYNIHEYYGTPGSWVCSKDNDLEVSMSTNLLLHDMIFEILGLYLVIFDVRKGNKQVWKMHQSLGAQKVSESDIDYYFVNTQVSYQPLRDKMIKLLNLK